METTVVSILGLYRDDGKENGNYHNLFGPGNSHVTVAENAHRIPKQDAAVMIV